MPSLKEIGPGILTDLLRRWVGVEADGEVNDDITRVVASIYALVDCTIYVDVPDSAAISEDVTFPLSWLEYKWNRT